MHVVQLARFGANYVDKHLPTIPIYRRWRYSPGPVCNQHAPRRSPFRNIRLLRGRIQEGRCVAYAGVRLSKMAKYRIWVTTSLESANFLLGQEENWARITSLRHSNTTIAYVKSKSGISQVRFGKKLCH